MSVVSITGIPVPQGQKTPFRREVAQWWNDPDTTMQRTLFIKALTNFQEVRVDQELSYYQVAGSCILAISVRIFNLLELTPIHQESMDIRPSPGMAKVIQVNCSSALTTRSHSRPGIVPTWPYTR